MQQILVSFPLRTHLLFPISQTRGLAYRKSLRTLQTLKSCDRHKVYHCFMNILQSTEKVGHLDVGPNPQLRSPPPSLSSSGLMEPKCSFIQTSFEKCHVNSSFSGMLF